MDQGEPDRDQEILVLGQYCGYEQADGQARPAGCERGDRGEGEAQTKRIGCEHPHAEPCTRVQEDAEQGPERERAPGGDVPDRAARNCEAGCRHDDQPCEEGLPVEDTEPGGQRRVEDPPVSITGMVEQRGHLGSGEVAPDSERDLPVVAISRCQWNGSELAFHEGTQFRLLAHLKQAGPATDGARLEGEETRCEEEGEGSCGEKR